MVLTKRERYIAIATVAVLLGVGLYYYVFSPLLERKAEVDQKIDELQDQHDRAQRMFTRSRRMSREWAETAKASLTADVSEAESQTLRAISEWALDAGMVLSSVRPDRPEKERGFYRITFRATGTGGMRQVSRFIYRVQTAPIPARITDLQVSSRKEGTDDLTVQLGIATIYNNPDADKEKPGRPGAAPAAAPAPGSLTSAREAYR